MNVRTPRHSTAGLEYCRLRNDRGKFSVENLPPGKGISRSAAFFWPPSKDSPELRLSAATVCALLPTFGSSFRAYVFILRFCHCSTHGASS